MLSGNYNFILLFISAGKKDSRITTKSKADFNDVLFQKEMRPFMLRWLQWSSVNSACIDVFPVLRISIVYMIYSLVWCILWNLYMQILYLVYIVWKLNIVTATWFISTGWLGSLGIYDSSQVKILKERFVNLKICWYCEKFIYIECRYQWAGLWLGGKILASVQSAYIDIRCE